MVLLICACRMKLCKIVELHPYTAKSIAKIPPAVKTPICTLMSIGWAHYSINLASRGALTSTSVVDPIVQTIVGTSYFDEVGLYKQDEMVNYNQQVGYKRYNLTANLT